MIYFSFYHKTHRTWLFFGGLHVWKLVPNRKKTIYLQKDTTYIEIYIKLCIKIWLIQWPAFQLFGITYLTGRIKLTLLFHGALAEITYKISSPKHHNFVQADCKKCYGPGTCAVLQCAANWADSDLDLFGQFLFGLYHPWRKKLWKFKKSRFNAIYLDLFFGVFWVICFCGSDRMVCLITILHHHLEEYLETQRFPFAS